MGLLGRATDLIREGAAGVGSLLGAAAGGVYQGIGGPIMDGMEAVGADTIRLQMQRQAALTEKQKRYEEIMKQAMASPDLQTMNPLMREQLPYMQPGQAQQVIGQHVQGQQQIGQDKVAGVYIRAFTENPQKFGRTPDQQYASLIGKGVPKQQALDIVKMANPNGDGKLGDVERSKLDLMTRLAEDEVKRERDARETEIKEGKDRDRADKGVMGILYKGADILNTEGFEDAVGPVDNITAKIGGLFDSDSSRVRGNAERFIQEEILGQSEKMKGAITEKEWPRLERTRPSTSDHPSQWVDWYMTVLDAAEKGSPHLSGQVSELRETVAANAKNRFGWEPLNSGGKTVDFSDLLKYQGL